MKERPILFSAPMVRTLLDGSKTQTRRIVKPVGHDEGFVIVERDDKTIWPWRSDDGESMFTTIGGFTHEIPMSCPYGQPGDRVWVREVHTFCPRSPSMKKWSHTPDEARVIYGADDWWLSGPYGPHKPKMRPSIHMPRWASRILLEVVSVRVERLQEISESDATAEGSPHSLHLMSGRTAVENYCHLWECINGDGSWAENPWVWVVEFRRV